MRITAVTSRLRDSPTDARTASERQQVGKNKGKVETTRREPFAAVLVRKMKEGGMYAENYKG